MAGKSNYLANKELDHANGKTAFTMPSVWLALVTVTPSATDTGATITEATYTGYARKATVAADWNAASGGSTSNANALTFAACTGGTSTVVAVVQVDSATIGAGNVLRWGTVSLAVANGVTPSFAAGAIVIQET